MLVRMAIQMKEWGMMPLPGRGAQVPTYGINRWWGDAFEQLGRGISSTGKEAAEMVQARNKVEQAGDLAGFYGRLQDVVAEAGEELRERDNVRDWDYAWKEACAPLVQEALKEVPYESREAARQLAAAYTAAASLEQRRDSELERISGARDQWQQQLDAAVQQGDEQQAAQWLEQGRGVFVPDADMESSHKDVQSRASLSRWRARMQQQPMQALRDMKAGDAPLPQGEQERQTLEEEAEQARRGLQTETATQMSNDIQQDRESSVEWVREAREAGVISDEQANAARQPRRAMTQRQRCDWMRRIDECSTEGESALRLDICMSPHTLENRRELLRHLDTASTLPQEERLEMSRRLWSMYRSGRFGTPGDNIACARMASLQRSAQQLLANGDAKALAAWMDERRNEGNRWVCHQA